MFVGCAVVQDRVVNALKSMSSAENLSVDAADTAAFDEFVRISEPKLRHALTAAFGPVDGRAAAVDALSWAWEHWNQVREMTNPVGYLFRVGQTAARRSFARPFPIDAIVEADGVTLPLDRDLLRALHALSEQQRLVVLLVHAFAWTIRDTAEALELAPSTVQTHAERGLGRLRQLLEQTP